MITADTTAGRSTEPFRYRRLRLAALLRLAAASTIAGLLTLTIALRLPRQLRISTDIVGYPTFTAYNITRLPYLYYLAVLVFPTATLLLYLGFTRLTLRRVAASPASRHVFIPNEVVDPARWPLTTAAARLVAVGLVVGLEATIIAGFRGDTVWLGGLAATIGYVVLLFGGAALLQRFRARPRPFIASLARVNAQAATLTLFGLFGVSAVTRVMVTSDQAIHAYGWIPWWAAVGATALAFGGVWWRASMARSAEAIRDLERAVVLYLAVPVGLVLSLAALPAALGPMDVFHEGERLAAAQLTGMGWLPWRDIISTHGLLEDTLFPLLGFALIQDSRWGDFAAQSLLLGPLFFVSLYLLAAWAFARNWAFIAAVTLVILGPQLLVPALPRYIFWPLLLLTLAAVLRRPRWWLSLGFGVFLTAQALLVPELTYCIPACGIVLVLYELAHRRPVGRLARAFSRTVWTIAGGVGAALALVVFLVTQHALADFVRYYVIFAPGHALTGGLPVHLQTQDPLFLVVALSPIGALLLAFWYYAAAVVRRRPLDTLDWVMGAATMFALVFYTRFLDRADLGHAYLSFNATLPVLAFLLFRFASVADAALTHLWRTAWVSRLTVRPATIVLLAATSLVVGAPVLQRLAQSPDRFRTVAPAEPSLARLGFVQAGTDTATYTDLSRILAAYLTPGDWVFDFSNEPGLYYYLLGLAPRTRYFHVSMAIPELAQKDLIGQLQRHPPKLVVFSNDLIGLPNWDGISNSVRHYDISQYILDNYRPLLSTHTQVIYALASASLTPATASNLPLHERPSTTDLYFRTQPCDWGYAPNFLSIMPPPPTHGVQPMTLPIAASAGATISGWAADPKTRRPASQVILVMAGREVDAQEPGVPRPDVAAALGEPGLTNSGFLLDLPPGDSGVRVFALSQGGAASELSSIGSARSDGPGSGLEPPTTIRLEDGRSVPVVPGSVIGYVDGASFVATIGGQDGAPWSLYRWLEITTRSGLRNDVWWLSDAVADSPDHRIAFRTVGGTATRYRLYVGNCSQWHGYSTPRFGGAGPLYLFHQAPQDILSVRLLP